MWGVGFRFEGGSSHPLYPPPPPRASSWQMVDQLSAAVASAAAAGGNDGGSDDAALGRALRAAMAAVATPVTTAMAAVTGSGCTELLGKLVALLQVWGCKCDCLECTEGVRCVQVLGAAGR